MSDLVQFRKPELPTAVEELRRYIYIREKQLILYRVKLDTLKKLGDGGKKIQAEIRQLLTEGNRIAREKLYGDAAIGEWSAGLSDGIAGRPAKNSQSKLTILRGINLTKQTANKLEHLAGLKALIDEAVKEAMAELELCTRQRVLNKVADALRPLPVDPPPLPKDKFRIIYADPPWEYPKGKKLSIWKYGDVHREFPTMDIEAIRSLPVKDIVWENCVLFLWATWPKLHDAFHVLEAWGFDYKTGACWDKVKHNFGYYFSVRSELLLVGGIGKSTPDVNKLYDNVFEIERSSRHSEKPTYFRNLIDELYPPSKERIDRIELFCRGELPEWWERWGYEPE